MISLSVNCNPKNETKLFAVNIFDSAFVERVFQKKMGYSDPGFPDDRLNYVFSVCESEVAKGSSMLVTDVEDEIQIVSPIYQHCQQYVVVVVIIQLSCAIATCKIF